LARVPARDSPQRVAEGRVLLLQLGGVVRRAIRLLESRSALVGSSPPTSWRRSGPARRPRPSRLGVESPRKRLHAAGPRRPQPARRLPEPLDPCSTTVPGDEVGERDRLKGPGRIKAATARFSRMAMVRNGRSTIGGIGGPRSTRSGGGPRPRRRFGPPSATRDRSAAAVEDAPRRGALSSTGALDHALSQRRQGRPGAREERAARSLRRAARGRRRIPGRPLSERADARTIAYDHRPSRAGRPGRRRALRRSGIEPRPPACPSGRRS
jgi:hypothetical protein